MYLYVYLDTVLTISIQNYGCNQNIIGQRQGVICSISIPPNMDSNTIELGWLNEEDIITDDSRVTIDILSDYSNSTVIMFDPLMEEDKGEYLCYAIINGSFVFDSIDLQNFTGK